MTVFTWVWLATASAQDCPPDISAEACEALGEMLSDPDGIAPDDALPPDDGSIWISPIVPFDDFEEQRYDAGSAFDRPGAFGVSVDDFQTYWDTSLPVVEVSPPTPIDEPLPPPIEDEAPPPIEALSPPPPPTEDAASDLPTGPSIPTTPPPPL